MGQNILLEQQILAAYAVLKTARFDGDLELIDGCQRHLDALLDKLLEAVPA